MIWGISRYRRVGRGARCIKVGNWTFKLNNFQLIILILLSWPTVGRLSLSKIWRAKLKFSTLNFKITFLITYLVVLKLIGNQILSIIAMHFLLFLAEVPV